MTHLDLLHRLGQACPTQDLGAYAAAELLALISEALAQLPRGERVLALVRLSQHVAQLSALGPDRCADPDQVAKLLGLPDR